MKKRGVDLSLLDQVVDILRKGKTLTQNTATMHYAAIFKAFENVILNQIGFWSIFWKTIF